MNEPRLSKTTVAKETFSLMVASSETAASIGCLSWCVDVPGKMIFSTPLGYRKSRFNK